MSPSGDGWFGRPILRPAKEPPLPQIQHPAGHPLLIFQKGSPSRKVWFFDVHEDGFSKTASITGRPPIKANHLPLLRQLWDGKDDSDRSFSVDVDLIRTHGYKLTADEYRETNKKAGWVPLGGKCGLCDIVLGGTPPRKQSRFFGGPHLWVRIGDMSKAKGLPIIETEETISDEGVEHSSVKLIQKGTVLLSFKLSVDKVAITGADVYSNEAIAALIPKDKRILPKYLYYVLPRLGDLKTRKAAKGKTSSKARLSKVLIPLPSRRVQKKLILEMDREEARIRSCEQKIEQSNLREETIINELTRMNNEEKASEA